MRALGWLLLVAAPCVAADPWTSLHGHWRGVGTVRGMQADIDLTFRPALAGQAHHLRFSNLMRGEDGREWRFLAEATYLCSDAGVCRGHWYDSRGAILPLTARSQARALVVEWGDAATERGRTTYAIQDDGALAIIDEVQEAAGEWTVFGETRSTRVGE
jgi:hypothetical protein